MPIEPGHIVLSIDVGHRLDQEERTEISMRLRKELLDLNTVSVEPFRTGQVPSGSKGVPVDWGTLTVSLAPAVLTAVVSTIKVWIKRHDAATVTVTRDGDKIEVTGNPSPGEQRLIDAFVDRHKT
jgi:hypothetical protein